MTTFDILKDLQSEVGSRRAGTAGEQNAQTWLVKQIEDLGLSVELDEFRFVSSELYRPLLQILFVISVFAGIVLSYFDQTLLGWAVLVLAFFTFFNLRKRLEIWLAGTPSQNVIAGLERPFSEYVQDQRNGPAVLLCAHYDTPRNSLPWVQRLRSGFRFLGPLALLGIVLSVILLIITAVGSQLSVRGFSGVLNFVEVVNPWISGLTLVMVTPMLLLMLVSSMSVLVQNKSDSPGADDNGSGTALVLELAHRFQAEPPKNITLFFAWWGAEEYGLFGSRQFVRRYHDLLDKDRFYVINADCVGVGDLLAVHSGQGTLSRRHTDPGTLDRIDRVAAELGVKTIRTWESIISGGSSDHAEWVNRGYRHAISILRENYRKLSLPARIFAGILRIPDANQLELDHIHTANDNIEGIDPAILQASTDFAEAYIRDIDEEDWPK